MCGVSWYTRRKPDASASYSLGTKGETMPTQNMSIRLKWNERQQEAMLEIMEKHKARCTGKGCKTCTRHKRQLAALEREARYIRLELKP